MKNLLKTFFFIILFLPGYLSFSQNTIIHDIPWHSDTVGMWGSGSTAWSINQIDTLVDFTIGPYSDQYSWVYTMPWPIDDSVGMIFDYGAYASMQLIFEMVGWSGGAVKVNYPTKIQMDFPPNGSFSNGSWVTIPSEYREQDTIVHPTDYDNWDIYADWPDAGKIELFINMDVQAHADLIYSNPSDPFNITWDTLHVFEPININLDTFDIFLVDLVNGEYVIPWVAYHVDPFTGNTIIDSVYFLHDSIGWPLQFPPIFYDLIGISGDISIPDIQNYTKWIENEQRLYTWGNDEYLHINLDIIKFVEMMCHYLSYIPSLQELESVYQALQYEEGDTSIYLFTDPISGEDFTADLTWDLIDAELWFTNTMNQTLSFEDNQEYTFFGIPIPPNHYPNVWNVFQFPMAMDYNVLDTLGAVIESGTSDSIKFCADYDLQLRIPCNDFDSLPVTISHTIDPWLTNMVRDSIDVDFYIKVLEIAYSIGTPSNPILSGNFLLYEDTLTLGTIAGPPLFGPPLFMPWLIDGYFVDTTIAPIVYVVPINNPLHDTILFSNVLCYGTSSGSATAIAIGGETPYVYQWTDETGNIISSNDSVTNISVGSYYITITDANGCTVEDSISLSNINPPIQTSHTSVDVLCNGDSTGSAILTVTGGTPPYQYLWSPDVGNTQNISNLIAGTYFVTVTDNVGCTALDTITIINLNLPLIITIDNITNVTCYNGNDGSVALSVAGGMSPYSYLWSNGATTQDLNNIVANNYIITVSDNFGCTVSQSVTVTQPPQLFITVTASPSAICPNGTSTLTASGAATYEWSGIGLSGTTGTSVTSTPLATTTYSVTGTDVIGCTAITQVTVIVNIPPTISITGTPNICNGQSSILTANGGVSYIWSTSELTNSISVSPNSNATYYVTGTDANTCTNTAQYTVTVTEMPNANAGDDAAVCQLNYNLNAIPSVGSGIWTVALGDNVNFSPSVNSPNATITVGTTGIYSLIWHEDNGNGCIDADTVVVQLTQPPTSDFTISSIPCYGDAAVINYSGTGNALCTYIWSWNDANVVPGIGIGPHISTWQASGTQTVGLIVSLNNCPSTQTFVTVTNPTLLTSTISHTDILCNGEQNGMVVSTPTGGTFPYSYQWNNGSNTSALTDVYAGLYTVTITDINGCTTTNEASINEPTQFVIGSTPDQSICYGLSTTLNISATGGTEPYTYYWNGLLSNNFITVNPDTTTTYTATAIDANGCASNISSTIVTVSPKVELALNQSANSICIGEPVIIIPIITGGIGAPYTLLNDEGNIVTSPVYIYPEQSGWHTITAQDGCGTSDTNSIYITVYPLPPANANADFSYGCQPLTVQFNELNPENGQTYLWNFGDNADLSLAKNPVHTYKQAGTYSVTLTVTSEHNCQNVITYNNFITVWAKPVAHFIWNPYAASFTNPVITFTNMTENGIPSYWNFGDGDSSNLENPVHRFPNIGSFLVELIAVSENGCLDTVAYPIEIKEGYTFYAPTAFSPDNDNKNDEFYILAHGIKEAGFYLGVYDRWGEIIWETTNFDETTEQSDKWDGSAKYNNIVPVGTYKWLAKFKDFRGVLHEKSGNIIIIW